MNKYLVGLCTLVLLLCTAAIAGEKAALTLSATDSPKHEILLLQERIVAAKAAGLQPDPAWQARINELMPPERGIRGLDQAGGDCANATVIGGLPLNDSGVLDATDDCVGIPYFDVFYMYTVQVTGSHTFDMCGGSTDTYMKLYLSGTCCGGTYLSSDDVCSMNPSITTNLTAGQVVYVECGTYSSSGYENSPYFFNVTGPTLAPGRCCYGDIYAPQCGIMLPPDCDALGGMFTAGITDCIANPCAIPLPGELCANAIPLAVPSTVSGNTSGYTNDYDATCPYSGSTSKDVVYSFTPTEDIQVTFDLCQSGYDTKLYVYQDACVPPYFACNDDYCPNYRSYIECLQLYGGHTYFVVVDGYGGANGDYTLVSTPCVVIPPPVNDDCANALPIEVNGNGACGTTLGATLDCPTLDIPEVWYSFTLTECMDISVSYCGTVAEGSLNAALFAESCCGTLIGYTNYEYLTCPDGLITLTFGQLAAGTYWLPVGFLPAGDFCVQVNGVACPNPFECPCLEPLDGRHCATDGAPIADYMTVDVPLFVPMQYHITDVNVCFDIMHTFDADLTISLVSPLGVEVPLSVNNGGGSDNFHCTTLDDEATTPLSAGTAPFEGAYIPDNPLAGFDGQNALGTWFLRINDCCGGDVGMLNWFCLTFEWDYLLAVELAGFDAIAGDSRVVLNWQTASETNNDHFEISRDGQMVSTVEATGNATGSSYSWTDEGLMNGRTYSYTLYSVDANGTREELDMVEATPHLGAGMVTEYALHQNFPNPFNPTTELRFDLVQAGFVTLKVYNLMGQEVATVVNGELGAGQHIVSFDANNLPSGAYLYRIEANGYSAVKKMLLMK